MSERHGALNAADAAQKPFFQLSVAAECAARIVAVVVCASMKRKRWLQEQNTVEAQTAESVCEHETGEPACLFLYWPFLAALAPGTPASLFSTGVIGEPPAHLGSGEGHQTIRPCHGEVRKGSGRRYRGTPHVGSRVTATKHPASRRGDGGGLRPLELPDFLSSRGARRSRGPWRRSGRGLSTIRSLDVPCWNSRCSCTVAVNK